MKEELVSLSVEETKQIGFNFAKNLNFGDVVAFYGNLGVGKTEFIRGICEYFKVESQVSSPTYTLINEYSGLKIDEDISLYHLDLYRVKDSSELLDIGYYEYVFQDNGITLIEWSENSNDELPEKHIKVKISIDENNNKKRIISIVY